MSRVLIPSRSELVGGRMSGIDIMMHLTQVCLGQGYPEPSCPG
jgi:hypothetical protein